jgi:hypothetical protein
VVCGVAWRGNSDVGVALRLPLDTKILGF